MANDEEIGRRLAALEAANVTLAREVAELRQEVSTTRAGGFRSMRDSRRCPACGAGSLVHVRRSQEAGYMGLIDRGLAHDHSAWKGIQPRGAMESFACRACGLVEWHVIDFDDVKCDGENVVAIEPDAVRTDGPFR